MNTKKLMKHKQSKHQDVLIYIQKFFSSWNKGGCTGNLASSLDIFGCEGRTIFWGKFKGGKIFDASLRGGAEQFWMQL